MTTAVMQVTVLIEINRVAPDWGCNTFSGDSIVFNENDVTGIYNRTVDADAPCKQALA